MPDLTAFQTSPDFTFFHTPAWIAALGAAFPRWRDRSRILTLPDGRRVWLPLLETDRVGPWRWLEGMPFGFYGGPVVESGSLGRDDLGFVLRQSGGRAGWLALNFDPLYPLARPEAIPAGMAPLSTHLLSLEGGYERVEAGFSSMVQRHVRRAGREGLIARRGRGPADFAAYHDLATLAAGRWGLDAAPHPRPLFDALAALPEDTVSLWLAEQAGQITGGLISIHYAPGRVMYWSSAMHPDHAGLSPTRLLQHAAIEEACRRGAAVYNLGPSVGFDGAPLDGVRQAKEALGGRPFEYAIPILMNPWAMRTRAALAIVRRRLAR